MSASRVTVDAPITIDTTQAACLDFDPDLWFAENDSIAIRDAKAICRSCPIRQACLDQAIFADIPHGIYGGLTADERRKIIHPDRKKARR